MCIIIVKPAGASLALSTVLRAYQRNDDGWGMVAITPNGLVVRRDYGRDADESLLDAYDELRDHTLVIHCRIGTSGKMGVDNTHPFEATPGLWLFHNGIIDIDRSAAPQMCDSYHAAKAIGAALEGYDAATVVRHPEYIKALETWVGSSRLVLVDSTGYVIVNENSGYWEKGCWFSNETVRPDYKPVSLTGIRDDAVFVDDVLDADEYAEGAFTGEYYGAITPRCYRVETQADEERLYHETVAFIDRIRKFDVDDIAQYCADEPELAGEALYLLVNSRSSVTASYTHR